VLLINHARLPDATFRDLQATVAGQATLERVLEWGRTQTPARRVEEIITQDEFTHDMLVPLDNSQYLAYDVTWLGVVTAVAVWGHRPSARELLDARLQAGWKPTPSSLKGGDRVLGYAACVFAAPGLEAKRTTGPNAGA